MKIIDKSIVFDMRVERKINNKVALFFNVIIY